MAKESWTLVFMPFQEKGGQISEVRTDFLIFHKCTQKVHTFKPSSFIMQHLLIKLCLDTSHSDQKHGLELSSVFLHHPPSQERGMQKFLAPFGDSRKR